jgi:hypothetical protein
MRNPSPSSVAAAALAATLSFPLAVHAAEQRWVDRLPIVDRAIEHHGGAAYTSSETTLRLCSNNGCFDLDVVANGGVYSHTVTRDDGSLRVRASNDEVEMWESGVEKPVPPEEDARRRRFVSARVYFPFLPYRLNDPGVQKLDLGIVDWEGRKLHQVRIRFGGGDAAPGDGAAPPGGEAKQTSDEYMYWFDPDSGEVVYFAYDFVDDPSGIRFRREIDPRRIGGILFFDQENLGADGDGYDVGQIDPRFVAEKLKPISVVRLTSIEVRPLAAQ